VIVSFRSKALTRWFEAGDARGIRSDLRARLKLRLEVIHRARTLRDIDLPGYRLHPLKGSEAGRWAIAVNGPWRVTCEFDEEKGDAHRVDLEQYH
jgi:toxin HigB-1